MNITLQEPDVKVLLDILVGRWRTNLSKLREGGSAHSTKVWAEEADAARRMIWTIHEQTGLRPFLFKGEDKTLGLVP